MNAIKNLRLKLTARGQTLAEKKSKEASWERLTLATAVHYKDNEIQLHT